MTHGIRPIDLGAATVTLRQFRPPDADRLFAGYFGAPEASRFLARRAHGSVHQTRKALQQRCLWVEDEPRVDFGWIIAAAGDEPVGILYSMVKGCVAEIHYGICVAHWGRGFATAAVRSATEWLLSHDTVFRVWTAVDCENVATQKVLSKAGFEREGLLKSWLVLPAIDEHAARDAFSYCRIKR